MYGFIFIITTLAQLALGWLVYPDDKSPDEAFDCTLKKVYRTTDRNRVVFQMSQDIPFSYTYSSKEVSKSFSFSFSCLTSQIVNFELYDLNHPIFALDEAKPFPNRHNLNSYVFNYSNSVYQELAPQTNMLFGLQACNAHIKVESKLGYVELSIEQNGVKVNMTGFRVEKKMLYFILQNRAQFFMGLGERNGPFKIQKGVYTLWAKDNLFAVQREEGCQNTYGYHPMMLYQDETSRNYSVMYFRTAAGMQLDIRNNDFAGSTIKESLVELHSNSLQLLLFAGLDPDSLIKTYHQYLGGYRVPPLWYFGLHQSRWGYKNSQTLEEVAQGYNISNLKLQSIFLDIDYMKNKKPFQIDTKNFPPTDLISLKKKHRVKLVPIVDYAFNLDLQRNLPDHIIEELEAFEIPNIYDVMIRNSRQKILLGEVWPGTSIFPDFFHPKADSFWSVYLRHVQSLTSFDGIWLDMNEIANFPNTHELDDPGMSLVKFSSCGESLSNMSLPLSAVHSNGLTQFNLHNLNGIKQQSITHLVGSQSFGPDFYFISRNTFPGSGQYCGHWSGDNLADYQHLGFSVSSLLNFNLFGIPFSGSDICGFFGNYQSSLCARWIQLNSLFPLFRNHNHINADDQEFYKIGSEVRDSAYSSMNLRYSLLKYIYNVFIRSQGVGTIYAPLFMKYPLQFSEMLDRIDKQVLIGDHVFFSEDLQEVYFPRNYSWYHYSSGELLVLASDTDSRRASFMDIPTDQELPLFVRQGALVLSQTADQVYRVEDLEEVDFTARCYLNSQGSCSMIYHSWSHSQILRSSPSLLHHYEYELAISIMLDKFGDGFGTINILMTLYNRDPCYGIYSVNIESVLFSLGQSNKYSLSEMKVCFEKTYYIEGEEYLFRDCDAVVERVNDHLVRMRKNNNKPWRMRSGKSYNYLFV